VNDEQRQPSEQRQQESSEKQQPTGAQQSSRAEQPSEEEMRRRIEEQLRNVRVQDLLLESVVGVINLSARRIAKQDERDLEQARVGIEAVRATVDLPDPEPQKQVRSALSEVQMLYAKTAEGGESGGEGAPEPRPGGEGEAEPGKEPPPPEGRRRPSGLWTPPGT